MHCRLPHPSRSLRPFDPERAFFCWQVYRQVTHAAGARYVECLYDYDVTATATTNFLVDLRWLKGCLSAHNVTPS